MTLVLETSSDIHPESNDSIRQSLLRFGLNTIGDPVILGSRAFHYYTLENIEDADSIINELLKLPGVDAAYLKPDALPPHM
jgi:hypothetical protein